ncbi:DnaJ C-terminal domain-containing protein [Streptomyces californicus]|uniref:DnaJ C-terminal domain-containing protein n=1 Tax=Streptomyces californicus TaxID=67351 RepID=UPI0004C25E32|nr:DnaJ C-terminal domain-containing protein [Streptomyces californicus]QRV59484.1 hypothetical protein I6J40_35085 [Streptomyces californicus]
MSGHVTVGPAQAKRGAIIPVQVTKGKPCPACATCEDEGRLIQWQHNHRVRLPSGIEDGQKIRLCERGAPGTHGGVSGDLYVTS